MRRRNFVSLCFTSLPIKNHSFSNCWSFGRHPGWGSHVRISFFCENGFVPAKANGLKTKKPSEGRFWCGDGGNWMLTLRSASWLTRERHIRAPDTRIFNRIFLYKLQHFFHRQVFEFSFQQQCLWSAFFSCIPHQIPWCIMPGINFLFKVVL